MKRMKRLFPTALAASTLLASATPLLAAAAAAGGGAGAESDSPLKPISAGFITALTTLIVFGLLVWLLSKYAWGPIVQGLQAREDKIRNDIEEAERARADAKRERAEYAAQMAGAEQRVRQMIDRAQVDGHALAKRIRDEAEAEAKGLRERTTREIDAARRQAVADVREQAATLSVAIAEKILRRNLNEDDQKELVRASLEEMEPVGV